MRAILLTGDPFATWKQWKTVITRNLIERSALNTGDGRLVIIHGGEFPAELIASGIAQEDYWRVTELPIPGNAADRRETAGVAMLAALKDAGYTAEVVLFHAYLDRDPRGQAIAQAGLDAGLIVRQVVHAQDTGKITTPTGRDFAKGDRKRGTRDEENPQPPKRQRPKSRTGAGAAVYQEAMSFA